MADGLLHRYAELVTAWSEPGTRLARLADLLAVRDEELERLRAEHATQADSIRSYQLDIRKAEAAIARVRRLCELTIAASCRVQAIEQARDTLAALDDTAGT